MASQKTILTAQARAKAGKGAARATRRAGSIPGVIYGDHKEPVLISLTEKDMKKALSNKAFYTHLCDLEVEGKKHLVLPREVQLHPVSDRPVHADFLRVTEKTMIRVHVPVKVTNEKDSPGITKGGVLNLVQHEIEVYCAATDIPEAFVIDLTGMEIGSSLHIEDLTLAADVKPTMHGNFTILTLVAPSAVKSEAEDAAAAAAAPAADAAAAPAAEAGKDAEKK